MHSATPTGECRSWNAHASLLCTLFLVILLLCGCGSEAVYLTVGTETDSEASEPGDSSGDTDTGDGSGLSDSGESDEDIGGDSGADGAVGDGSDADGSSDSAEYSGSVYVYVCGAVMTPGLYELDAGSRVYDAILAAGGLRDDASEDYWNQAALVSDGQMIDVPTEAEVEAGLVDTASGSSTDASSESSIDASSVSGADSASGTDSSGSGTDADAGTSSSGRININTATAAELMEIPGIGEARAEAIISYREQSGGFSAIEDIKNVSGIGDALFEKMKDYIEV